jgi:mannose-6-phosphate isomerase
LKVLDYTELVEPRVQQKKILNGLWALPVEVADFTVYKVEASATNMLIDLELKGKAIIACVSGELTISTSKDETITLSRGEVGFMAEARLFSVSGSGTGYLTMG